MTVTPTATTTSENVGATGRQGCLVGNAPTIELTGDDIVHADFNGPGATSRSGRLGIEMDSNLNDGHPAAAAKSQRGDYSRLAHRLTDWTGSGWAAAAVVAASLAWLVIGTAVNFPRWWELSATVGLPALTLLALVLVQHTQNHNNRATQLKLDERIRATEGAHDRMMSVEDASRDDLNRIQASFRNQSGSPESAD